MPFRGVTNVDPRNYVLDAGPDNPREGALLRGDICRPIVTYLRMANVPAQWTRKTNALAAARGDNMAMRPFAKLLWILI